jgi:hypothetical protein
VAVAGTASITIVVGGNVVSLHTFDPDFMYSAVPRESGSVGIVNITGEGSEWTADGLEEPK